MQGWHRWPRKRAPEGELVDAAGTVEGVSVILLDMCSHADDRADETTYLVLYKALREATGRIDSALAAFRGEVAA